MVTFLPNYQNQKWLIISIIALIAIIFTIKVFLRFIASGSYPFAEIYSIQVNESVLIKKIMKFKEENPQFVPPKISLSTGQTAFLDDRRKGYWYSVYFYYSTENQILHCWTRSISDSVTQFAFVAVNNGLIIGQWKNVNDDFGYFENKKIIKQFEERILNKIKVSIKHE